MIPRNEGTSSPAWGIAPDGHRLPAGIRLGPVRLQVADLERSMAFYGDFLGLRVLSRTGEGAVLGAGRAGSPRAVGAGPSPSGRDADGDSAGGETASPSPKDAFVPLVELRVRPGVAPVPRHGLLGLYHFAILLPDRAALGRFAAYLADGGAGAQAGVQAGAQAGAVTGASDHLVSEALYLRDPDGLGIEVYADRPRESWQHDGRQLVMATDPLDVDDLVAAAAGEPWTGMPPDTVMGHVHLHVGELARAEAFYHQALGFDKVVWSYPGALFLSAGGYHHHLGLNTWARGARLAGDDDARLLEWELVLPDAETVSAAAISLEAAGFQPEGAPEGVTVRDPWGTGLRLRTDVPSA